MVWMQNEIPFLLPPPLFHDFFTKDKLGKQITFSFPPLLFSKCQTPTLREKSILLVKMMTYIEKRFPEDLELNAQFLDLVNYVYR